jgi:hypothetical protein
MPTTAGARLPHPMGAPENRWSSRRQAADARAREWADRAKAITALRTIVAYPPKGSYVAAFEPGGAVRLEEIGTS